MKYKEEEILEILKQFIEDSYHQHYSSSDKKTQTLDLIMEMPDGIGFIKGSILKYISRFQKKRDNPKSDLLKLMHYAVLLYYFSFLKDEVDNKDVDKSYNWTNRCLDNTKPETNLCDYDLKETNLYFNLNETNLFDYKTYMDNLKSVEKPINLDYNNQNLDMYDEVPLRTQTIKSNIDNIPEIKPVQTSNNIIDQIYSYKNKK